jgi:hypothetical protein
MYDLNYEDTKHQLDVDDNAALYAITKTSKKGNTKTRYFCEIRKYGFIWEVGKRTLTALKKEGYAVIYE